MDQISNQIKTDDLAFSAWLRMKGCTLVTSHQIRNKRVFSFDIAAKDEDKLKIEFLNSRYIEFYNEIRNLKKLI